MKSIKLKILFVLILLSIVVSGLVGGIVFWKYYSSVNAQIEKTLLNAASFVDHTFPYPTYDIYRDAIIADEPEALSYKELMGQYAADTGLSFLYLVTRDGEIFPTLEISNYMAGEKVIFWENPSPESVASLETGQPLYSKPYTDEFGSFVSFYMPLSTSGGTPVVIGADFDVSFVKEQKNATLLSFITTYIIGILIALGTSFLIANSISKPIRLLDNQLAGLAENDADLTVRMDSRSNDEIGKVAESFNQFVGRLQEMVLGIKEAINHTDRIKAGIKESTQETSTASEEIHANLTEFEKQIAALDDNISETVAAIEEITRNIESMDEQIVDQSSMVEQSTASITEMITSLSNVNLVAQNKKKATLELDRLASQGQSSIEETSQSFKSVVDNIVQIQEMASTINGIASQTNLLSMNAAIEAAHAGDSGRGFAVVAEEIRKLADSAGQSSSQITQLIKDITDSVGKTEKNVSTTSEVFAIISGEVRGTVDAFTEIEQSVSELNIGGTQILEATNNIHGVTQSVRASSKEIKNGTSMMLNSSEDIKHISQSVRSGMDESLSGIQNILGSIQSILQQTQELDSIVGELKMDFGKFTTSKEEIL